MEPRSSAGEDVSSSSDTTPPLRRRLSMEEDIFYQHIMSTSPRRPSQTPTYQVPGTSTYNQLRRTSTGNKSVLSNNMDELAEGEGSREGERMDSFEEGIRRKSAAGTTAEDAQEDGHYSDAAPPYDSDEALPNYSNSIALEGVFHRKHEIENTTKRAEDRQWHTSIVSLNGTALSIYNVKKDWGWGRSRDGPTICPDNPPWIRKAKLEKTYSLLHADAGIAADYKKRRYVIRIRAETDQFLLSCIELSTFVKWLEHLFAAIDVAAPIDERDFPRDMSIPRIQRIRWYRSRTGAVYPSTQREEEREREQNREAMPLDPLEQRPPSPEPLPNPTPAPPRLRPSESSGTAASDSAPPHIRLDQPPQLGASLYPNASVDPHTGKWFPEHQWSTAHDLLYAKLCYSNLLFRSPRKSNYIVSKGKQWFVDWGTGRMVRVLPPAYGESDFFGPWQVIHTENMRL